MEKLRQEVDQLKGRGGPLVDGIHSRYWSSGGLVCCDGVLDRPRQALGEETSSHQNTAQDLRVLLIFRVGTL